jgi:hypothetical protein
LATVLDAIITPALKEIGVLAAGETATSEDAADALSRLNRLIDRLAAESSSIFYRTRTTWTISANDGEYTVGSGANVNIARPVFVHQIGFIDTSTDPDTEYPLKMLTEDGYAAIPQKAQTSTFPQFAFYNPTYANATLTLWPVPTSSTLSGVIYHSTAVTSFATTSTSVSLPPGYEEALVTNLALLLCPQFERQPSPVLVQAARESMATLKRVNSRLSDLSFEAGALIGGNRHAFNIRTGE